MSSSVIFSGMDLSYFSRRLSMTLRVDSQLNTIKNGMTPSHPTASIQPNAHLVFGCSLVKFVWAFMGEALGWSGCPNSMDDLVLNWFEGGFGVSFQVGLTCLVGVAWAIWLTRNKMCMSRIFPDNPIDVIFLCLSFAKKWRILTGREAKALMDWLLDARLLKAKEFRPCGFKLSDAEFI
jgi:hypothetical protein